MQQFIGRRGKLIYVYRIPDEAHRGILKIGEATTDAPNYLLLQPNSTELNAAARERINQQTQTAGIGYDLLHTEIAISLETGIQFNDKEVHDLLLRSGIKRKVFDTVRNANEWFHLDLETAKKAIAACKEGRKSLLPGEITEGRSPIEFRPEQREAIEMTLKRYRKGNAMLWNAKMRFGKTLTALEVVKRMQFGRTLILTHRPVVDAGWFEDFQKIFYDSPNYQYGSKNKGETFRSLEAQYKAHDLHYVYFASIQDLRGSEAVGGKFDKNHEVFSAPWDFIIVDEAHEGTKTNLGKAVLEELRKPHTKTLELSGTPFNLLNDYKEDEIFTWDYVMEQRAKDEWEETHPGDPNPYAGLPALNIYTYDLGRLMNEFEDEDVAFNFREFFRTNDDGRFVHESHVRNFLNLLTKTDENYYPFSNEEFREIFRHTLWMVPGVKAAKALSAMLRNHPVFGLFDIVNVAGDGDEEEDNDEALRKVNKAIGPDPDATCTITLSCGRLTTGVSVKAWTGVLMLSGSYNTAASGYMQTIFRVQTPATINGRVKEQCYVFDFAPDRTLQVLASVPRVNTKAGKTGEAEKQALGEFLNFCPVIAYEGSRMEKLDVNRMLQELKRAYVDRVVRNGFEDGCLYNDELMKLTDIEIQDFEDLKKIVGQTKAMGNTGQIEINNQGLTNEEYEELENLEKKKKQSKKEKKELTEEEKRRLEELKKKREVKQSAISILRGISIRMPLLIYGADITDEDKELTIDNFTQLVDPQSWEEFMPKGVSKQKFNAFKKYYDPDIFTAAAKRIRAMARAADKLTIEERIERIASIFATFRNPDKETVLTPWRVVNMHMSDTLGGYTFFNKDFSETIEEPRFVDRGNVTADVFSVDTHLLEINSKSGLYPLYLAYNVYRSRIKDGMFSPETLEDHQALWDMVVAENIFVVCKTSMAKAITRRTLLGFRKGKTNMWAPDDLINKIKNQPELFIKKVHDLVGKNVKINAIVGNPPYQEEGENTRKAPIYHLFYDTAFNLAPIVTLITPGRFLFRVGQTPSEWMDKMLADSHFKVVDYFQKSIEIFPTVVIKGGVAIGLRDSAQDFGAIGFFSEFPQLISIMHKVKSNNDFVSGAFAKNVSSQGIYRFSDYALSNIPRIIEIQGKGTASKITSNAFENLPEIFVDSEQEIGGKGVQIMGRIKGQREIRWINAKYIQPCEYLDYYNVFVPEANGTGAIGEVLSTPVIGVPVIGHTDTFLSIGKFASAQEASACLKYVKSKFARCMLGTLKATQHNPKDTWANVPMQDFTEHSDIDWSKSVAEIDAQLYAKYGLSDEEIAFIESMIKPM